MKESSQILQNLCQHPIHLYAGETKVTFPAAPEGQHVQLQELDKGGLLTIPFPEIGNVTVRHPPTYQLPQTWPRLREGIIGVLVGALVASCLRDSGETPYGGKIIFYSPDSAPGSAVRNKHGTIKGTSRLIYWGKY